MRDFKTWRQNQEIAKYQQIVLTQEEFAHACISYFKNEIINEAVETSRYAVQVNYRTKGDEALEGFAKICLGYISAALKNQKFHTKHVFDEKPLRLLVAARNWDDGEWVGVVTWHPEHKCFILSKGFYNKDRKTVSIQNSKKCAGESAAEISRELHNLMHNLKELPDRHQEKLKPVPLKRGPKK